jgi:hypothetical protein
VQQCRPEDYLADIMSDIIPDDSPDAEGARWLTYRQLAEARGISRLSAERLVRRHRWRRQADNQGVARVLVPPEWVEAVDSGGTDVTPDTREDISPDRRLLAGAMAALESAVTGLRAQLDEANRRGAAAEARVIALEADNRAKDAALANASEHADAEITTLRDAADGMRNTLSRTEDRAVRSEQRVTEAEARIVGLETDLRAKDSEIAEQRGVADHARAEARSAQQMAADLHDRLDSAERDLAVAQHDAQTAQQAAGALRRADEARKARGRLRRAWDGWRGR